MEKLLLLLTVTLAAAYYTEDGEYIRRHIIVRNSGKCSIARNMRELIDRHHNYLRQKVAHGEEYLGKKFDEQEMCGLVYDCDLERVADQEQQKPGTAAAQKLGVVRFKREYKGSQLSAVQAGLEALVNDNDKLRQMTNPKATRFGCYVRYGRFPPKNVPEVDVVCVYDKKTRRKDAQKPKGDFCYEHFEEGDEESRKCSFYKNAKCLWDLCYVLEEGEEPNAP
ncbi:hypothetical protein Y032_0009g828 [Ancylostoma ceylanicum]|nr:hypothetical protein Y032_0009g828 [Ancylostoma ceylanicum]